MAQIDGCQPFSLFDLPFLPVGSLLFGQEQKAVLLLIFSRNTSNDGAIPNFDDIGWFLSRRVPDVSRRVTCRVDHEVAV